MVKLTGLIELPVVELTGPNCIFHIAYELLDFVQLLLFYISDERANS